MSEEKRDRTLLERYLAAEREAEDLFRQLQAKSVALAPAIDRLRQWSEARYAAAAQASQVLLSTEIVREVVMGMLGDLGIDPLAQPPAVIGAQVRRACLVESR